MTSFRKEYNLASLDTADVPRDPIELFNRWLDEAIARKLPEPNAMTLATVTPGGKAAARVVLLKEVIDDRFVFYTNYNSRKGVELQANPHAALVFLWLELQRQVRVEGKVEKVGESVSDEYYASRPRNSRIGAIVSPQSQVIESREELEKVFNILKNNNDPHLHRPKYWGGYQLIPDRVEFWQGRESRLHDRILYLKKDNGWTIKRLAP
ncbi:MAG: pyridoxamine 5'-phosphate oxidase [Bacteroidia bacterium]|nr:MAG: pyridoxamine 5'-phosphate oxidase [Bacteroidia bacterium]